MNRPAIYQSDIVQESFSQRLRKDPLLLFCLTGFSGIVGYKIYQIRKDRKLGTTKRLSLQLINLRLIAQGFVLGTLTLSVIFTMGKGILKKFTEPKNPHNNN